MAIIASVNCNYFDNMSLSRSLLYEINIMNFFHTHLTLTPEVFILDKKVWSGLGVVNFDIPIPLHIQTN